MASIKRDDNNIPFGGVALPCLKEKTVVFDGATANDPGDKDGTNASYRIFQIKGVVRAKIFAICDTDLVPASAGGTIEVGIVGNTAAIIAQTLQSDIDAQEMWKDASPALFADIPTTVFTLKAGQDVYQKVATQDCNSGQLHYICMFEPLSADGNVL